MGCGIRIVVSVVLGMAACGSAGDDVRSGPRFVVLGDAVVRDVGTGLEWTRRDDGAGLDWPAADAYCRSLAIGDARGWRLPDIAELRALHGGPPRTPCGDATCAIDAAFVLGGPYVWSATARGAPNARFYLDFQYGTELSPSISPRLVRRTLCVREGPRPRLSARPAARRPGS